MSCSSLQSGDNRRTHRVMSSAWASSFGRSTPSTRKDYQYAHDAADAYLPQRYLPDALEGSTFYQPGTFGFERDIAKRMAWWHELRERAGGSPPLPDDRRTEREESE
jgi:hypothetical protein